MKGGTSCSVVLGKLVGVCGTDLLDEGVDDVEGVTPEPGFFNIRNNLAPSPTL